MRRTAELALYEEYFADPHVEWCHDWETLGRIAEAEARRHGLSALDSLHVAAAHLLDADELVTTERPTKPIHRSGLVKVVYLYDLVSA